MKRRLAEQWTTVLLARLRVKLMQRACDSVKKLARKGKREDCTIPLKDTYPVSVCRSGRVAAA